MATKVKEQTQRKIRMKKKMTGKSLKPRDEGQLFRACGPKGVNIPEVAESLRDSEVELLIDKTSERDAVIKENKKYVDMLKRLLRAYAAHTDTTEKATSSASMSVGASSISEVGTATELAALLKKLGKLDLFDEMVSVKIGEVKKYVAEEVLIKEGFLKIETDKYSRVTFKRLQ